MKALLLWPVIIESFWSITETVRLAHRKSTSPPLGLMTIAALLPKDWEIRIIDRNAHIETDEDWNWCDIVLISAMNVQDADFNALIKKGLAKGKKVAVGGPYATACPEVPLKAGAHYLVLDEGELTIPKWIEGLANGDQTGIYRSEEKPDVTKTPIPRFDLIDHRDYLMFNVQFSRGCPFLCEFCDIIELYGRKPRTKTPSQMLAELDALYAVGWRRHVFLVDDNFIGNTKLAKLFLRELIPWMEKHNYPFKLMTEASLNLAQDDELLELMVKAGFTLIFAGIESPDVDSLESIRKTQNLRSANKGEKSSNPVVESCMKITRAGIEVMGGFIIGFDNEAPGADKRLLTFVEETGIPRAIVNLMMALPTTQLYKRLENEGRLLDIEHSDTRYNFMNFIPTRPLEEITREFINSFWQIYEPKNYLKRCYDHFMMMKGWRGKAYHPLSRREAEFVFKVFWRSGFARDTRYQFWRQLASMIRHKPALVQDYLESLAMIEAGVRFREVLRAQVERDLPWFQSRAVRRAGKEGTEPEAEGRAKLKVLQPVPPPVPSLHGAG
jgi:radical SAM superfamily enzyme YgiQ (UPF0313 family)